MGTSKGNGKYLSPNQVEEYFNDYKIQINENPRFKVEYVGREGKRVETPLKTPLTMVGFNNYVWEQIGMNSFLKDYFMNRDGRYEEYVHICSRIKENIRQDQIEGGMVGQYNASITQRLNGLKEQQDITVKEQPLFGED